TEPCLGHLVCSGPQPPSVGIGWRRWTVSIRCATGGGPSRRKSPAADNSNSVVNPSPSRAERSRLRPPGLLAFDFGAGFFQLLLDGLGFLFGNAFLDRFRGGFDQVLGFFQAEAGDDFADDFDHVDLLVAGVFQDDVEFGLGFSSRGSSATAASGSSN